VCFEGLKNDMVNACRLVSWVDVAFLKTFFKGTIMCAIAMDGNNQMVLVAGAVVEVEENGSWI